MLFVMMVMTVVDVLLRKFTNMTIIGCGEMTEMMMAVVVFCSLAQCQVTDSHIRIDLIIGRCTPKVQLLADTLTQSLCFLLFCLIAEILPTVIVRIETIRITVLIPWCAESIPSKSSLRRTANPAALTATDINAVTGVGAPS